MRLCRRRRCPSPCERQARRPSAGETDRASWGRSWCWRGQDTSPPPHPSFSAEFSGLCAAQSQYRTTHRESDLWLGWVWGLLEAHSAVLGQSLALSSTHSFIHWLKKYECMLAYYCQEVSLATAVNESAEPLALTDWWETATNIWF